MLTNSEKTFDANHPMAHAFETIREILHELKCLKQNLLLETWSPADYANLIGISVEKLEKLRERFIQDLFQPCNNGLVLTVPRVCITELGYAMQANKTFNNGHAPVGKILVALGNMANVDLGNTSRTFQQIRARKMGYTTYLDSLRLSLNNRINDVE
jgi:hypothetical protein